MALFKGLKENLYNRKLSKEAAKQPQRKPVKLSNAKTIGLLFDASKEAEQKVALAFANELKQGRKKVQLLGFLDAKEVPEGTSFPCFCNKDLGWNMTPKSPEVLDFIATPFDLLFALHLGRCAALEYVAVASKASFRVAPYRADNTLPYDLMIDGPKNDWKEIIKQMKAQLEQL